MVKGCFSCAFDFGCFSGFLLSANVLNERRGYIGFAHCVFARFNGDLQKVPALPLGHLIFTNFRMLWLLVLCDCVVKNVLKVVVFWAFSKSYNFFGMLMLNYLIFIKLMLIDFYG